MKLFIKSKKLKLTVFVLFASLSFSLFAADCQDAYDQSLRVYINSEKALDEMNTRRPLNSDELKKTMAEVKYFMKEGVEAGSYAMDLAFQCECDNAFSSIEESLNFAYRAQNTKTIEDAVYEIKRMQYFADEAMVFSQTCSQY